MEERLAGDEILSYDTLQSFRRPLVYAWLRDGYYLYIGSSEHGLLRYYNHNIVGVVEAFLLTDALSVWYCDSLAEAERLERSLIKTFAPKYNKTHNPNYERQANRRTSST